METWTGINIAWRVKHRTASVTWDHAPGAQTARWNVASWIPLWVLTKVRLSHMQWRHADWNMKPSHLAPSLRRTIKIPKPCIATSRPSRICLLDMSNDKTNFCGIVDLRSWTNSQMSLLPSPSPKSETPNLATVSFQSIQTLLNSRQQASLARASHGGVYTNEYIFLNSFQFFGSWKMLTNIFWFFKHFLEFQKMHRILSCQSCLSHLGSSVLFHFISEFASNPLEHLSVGVISCQCFAQEGVSTNMDVHQVTKSCFCLFYFLYRQ